MNEARPLWRPACVGIGSNLDDPVAQLRRAFAAVERLPDSAFAACSGLYRSAPMGPADQPDFINAAARFVTRLSPQMLLQQLMAIEDAQGRRRDTPHWGPRVIDLDLLLMGSLIVDEPGLRIPHPGIAERNFVLLPLAEIAPHAPVPGQGSVQGLLLRLGDSGARIERLDEAI